MTLCPIITLKRLLFKPKHSNVYTLLNDFRIAGDTISGGSFKRVLPLSIWKTDRNVSSTDGHRSPMDFHIRRFWTTRIQRFLVTFQISSIHQVSTSVHQFFWLCAPAITTSAAHPVMLCRWLWFFTDLFISGWKISVDIPSIALSIVRGATLSFLMRLIVRRGP